MANFSEILKAQSAVGLKMATEKYSPEAVKSNNEAAKQAATNTQLEAMAMRIRKRLGIVN